MSHWNLSRKDARHILLGLLLSALILRLVVSVSYINTFDTFWYKNWAIGLQDGIFDIYLPERAQPIILDYPPLYLFPLSFIGKLYEWIPAIGEYLPFEMLALKFFPVVFDVLCAWMFYRVCRRYSEWTGLLAASLWVLNPSQFFNTAFWGQTDQMMAFFLLLTFFLYEQKRPIPATVAYAVACLTKFQCLLFAPIVLSELFFHSDLKKAGQALLSGIATGIAVFLPFIAATGNLLLPFNVYLGGFGKYPYCTLNAFNLYGMLGLNWTQGFKDTETFLIGGFSYNMLSNIFLVLSVAGVVLLYKFARRRSVWITGLLLMQCVFMLTTRMHERYQIAVLPFALMAFIQVKEWKFFWLYQALSLATLLNQALLLFKSNSADAPWISAYEGMVIVFSFLNVLLFVYCIVICLRYMFSKPKETIEEVQPMQPVPET